MPFFRSFVVATLVLRIRYRSEFKQLSCRRRQQLRPVRSDDDGVLDADTTPAGQVDAGLDRHRHAFGDCIRGGGRERWSLVDLQADAVAQRMHEAAGVWALLDHGARRGIDLATGRTGKNRVAASLLSRGNDVVHLALPVRGWPEYDGARDVGV